LLGKINVSDINNQKLIQNKSSWFNGFNWLKLGKEITLKDLRYGRIFYTDADFDGNAISALLIFLYKYWPDIFERRDGI
jgi:DNA gyrase/topoisomerase IV subunit B